VTLILLRAGLASALGAVALSLLSPIESHIVSFLVILALWTAVSWATWRALTREAAPGSDEPSRAALVLIIAVFLRLALVLVAPTPSTDAYRYSWEGRVANAGLSPYRFPPSAPELVFLRKDQDARINNPGLSTIYPPLAQAAFRLVAAVSPDARAQKAFFAFCDLLVCALLMRLLRRRGLSVAWAAVYAWHPLVVVEFAAAGHLDSLMMLAMLVGLDLWETDRPNGAALAWAAAALVKVVPVVILPWLLLRRPRAAALFLAVVAVGLTPALPGLTAALSGTSGSGIAAFSSGWLANPSLYALLAPLIESSATRRVILAALLVFVSLPWARRCGDDAARYLCGMIIVALLASPVVQPWYVLWALPLALLTPFPAALAWSWAVGFMYFAIDPVLKASSAHLPWWHWFWLGEYIVVYGLLVVMSPLGKRLTGNSHYLRCNVSPPNATHCLKHNPEPNQ